MSDYSNGHEPNQNPLDEDETGKQCTFDEWLTLIFNYFPVVKSEYENLCTDMPSEEEMKCSSDNKMVIEHYIQLFESPAVHLAPYTPIQTGRGLISLVGMGHSFVWAFYEESEALDAPIERRKLAFKLMYNVYEQIFEPYCDRVLRRYTAKEDDGDDTILNSVCFLWWDMGLPMFKEPAEGPDPNSMNGTAIGVMERVLTNLTNPACWESALHGLGHYHNKGEERTERIIDTFLAAHLDLDPRLRDYANAARRGAIL